MAEKLKERLRHALPAFLLSAGLAVPLCGTLDRSLISFRILYTIAGVILAFELVSLHRATAWGAFLAAAAGAALWIFTGNGAQTLSDAGIAITLRVKGIRTAVPLAAEQVSMLIAAGTALLCCFASLRNATCIPSLILCTAVMLAVWLTDSMDLLPWLLPALAAALMLYSLLGAVCGRFRPGFILLSCYLLYAAALEEKHGAARYLSALFSRRLKIENGTAVPVQHVCVHKSMTLLRLLPQLQPGAYHMVSVTDDDGCTILATVREDRLYRAILENPAVPMGNLIPS